MLRPRFRVPPLNLSVDAEIACVSAHSLAHIPSGGGGCRENFGEKKKKKSVHYLVEDQKLCHSHRRQGQIAGEGAV